MLQGIAVQALTAVFILGPTLAPDVSLGPPEGPTCAEVEECIDEHSADLPTSLDAISELHPMYRRAVFNEMTVPSAEAS